MVESVLVDRIKGMAVEEGAIDTAILILTTVVVLIGLAGIIPTLAYQPVYVWVVPALFALNLCSAAIVGRACRLHQLRIRHLLDHSNLMLRVALGAELELQDEHRRPRLALHESQKLAERLRRMSRMTWRYVELPEGIGPRFVLAYYLLTSFVGVMIWDSWLEGLPSTQGMLRILMAAFVMPVAGHIWCNRVCAQEFYRHLLLRMTE